jgi:hypothetical protein
MCLESKAFKEHRKEQEEPKYAEKRKNVAVRRSTTSSSGWNLQDNSDSDNGNEKQLDWEVRGAMHHAREVALEERRNDLRRQIAKIDQHDEPVVTISNMPIADDSSPPFQEEDAKHEKKKKSKSDRSKKKTKKKSHKNEAHRMEGFVVEGEYGEKPKKAKSSSGKKKKKHSNDSDREMLPVEVPYRKGEFENEVFQRDYHEGKKRSNEFHSLQTEQASKSRHGNDARREKNPDSFEQEAHRYDKRSRSPIEARSSAFEGEHRAPQFQREQQSEREHPRTQMDRVTLQLEKEERQFEREARQLERERQGQLQKKSRQFKIESEHVEREPRKTQYERESRQAAPTEREPSRQPQFERESRPPTFEREPRHPKPDRDRQAPRESRQPAFERETRATHSEKESRASYYEQAQRSSPFDKRSGSPPFEARPSHLETLSPVTEKKHRPHHNDHSRTEEPIPRTVHQTGEKQKSNKPSVSQRVAESHSKEATRVKKHSPTREKPQLIEQKEFAKEPRKPNSKDADTVQKEVKQRAKKTEKQKEVTAFPVVQDQYEAKGQKTKFEHEERRKKGPRTPSPEFKQLPLSLDIEPAIDLNTSAVFSQKRENKDSRPKPPQPAMPKEVKFSKKDKPVAEERTNVESESESSDSDSSSSSDDSDSEEAASGSADEVKGKNPRKQQVKHETKKKKEVSAKEPKREQREDKKAVASHQHSTEATKERTIDDARNFAEEKSRHPEDRKERGSNVERREEERYYREHARDHRRTREDEAAPPARRVESRGSKEIRDYREFPRVDYREPRERERFREYDERLVSTRNAVVCI